MTSLRDPSVILARTGSARCRSSRLPPSGRPGDPSILPPHHSGGNEDSAWEALAAGGTRQPSLGPDSPARFTSLLGEPRVSAWRLRSRRGSRICANPGMSLLSKPSVGLCSRGQNCLDSAGDNVLVSFRGENACLDRAAKDAIE